MPSAVKEGAQAALQPPKGTIAFLPQACLARQNGQQRAQRAGGAAVGFPSGSGVATVLI